MPKKETTDRVSTDASNLMMLARRGGHFVWVGRAGVALVTGEVKRAAASCLAQDETRGKRKGKPKR